MENRRPSYFTWLTTNKESLEMLIFIHLIAIPSVISIINDFESVLEAPIPFLVIGFLGLVGGYVGTWAWTYNSYQIKNGLKDK